MIVVVDFDNNGIAEGVSFLSNDIGDVITGENSYTHKNYDYLINLATGGESAEIKHNLSTEYPVEIYIGNIHE